MQTPGAFFVECAARFEFIDLEYQALQTAFEQRLPGADRFEVQVAIAIEEMVGWFGRFFAGEIGGLGVGVSRFFFFGQFEDHPKGENKDGDKVIISALMKLKDDIKVIPTDVTKTEGIKAVLKEKDIIPESK